VTGPVLEDLDGILYPPVPSPGNKDDRYYFAHTIDQSLYQSKENPKEGLGLFGQFGISEGNPNPLRWMAFGWRRTGGGACTAGLRRTGRPWGGRATPCQNAKVTPAVKSACHATDTSRWIRQKPGEQMPAVESPSTNVA
jgi:hypothetical protein